MPVKKFTLNRNERLKSRTLINRLFSEGKTMQQFPFHLYYLFVPDADEHLKAGFGVSSRHFRKAVDRNRIKRLTRESYRLQSPDFKNMISAANKKLVLFFIYTGKELPEQDLITKKMKLILQRLSIIINEEPVAPA